MQLWVPFFKYYYAIAVFFIKINIQDRFFTQLHLVGSRIYSASRYMCRVDVHKDVFIIFSKQHNEARKGSYE